MRGERRPGSPVGCRADWLQVSPAFNDGSVLGLRRGQSPSRVPRVAAVAIPGVALGFIEQLYFRSVFRTCKRCYVSLFRCLLPSNITVKEYIFGTAGHERLFRAAGVINE